MRAEKDGNSGSSYVTAENNYPFCAQSGQAVEKLSPENLARIPIGRSDRYLTADLLHLVLRAVKFNAGKLGLSDAVEAAECMDDFASHMHARPVTSENIIEFGALVRGFLKHYYRRFSDRPTLDLCNDIYVELDATRAYRIANHSDMEISKYAYPEAYHGPRAIETQIMKAAEIFGLDPGPALRFSEKLDTAGDGSGVIKLPSGAEGWFAVPSAKAVGKIFFSETADQSDNYSQVLKLAHAKLGLSRNFHSYLTEQINADYIRILPRTRQALETAEANQSGDILILPAQLGARHRGKSPSLAKDTFSSCESGLDSFSLCSILLTHPERLTGWRDLGIECPGNAFDYYRSGLFTHTPNYSFRGTGLRAYHIWNWDGFGNYGSATFFTPELYKR